MRLRKGLFNAKELRFILQVRSRDRQILLRKDCRSTGKTKQQLRKTKQVKPVKLRNVRTMKETVNKVKRQPKEWKKIFTNDTTDRGIISRIYRELREPNNNTKQFS